MDPLGLAKSIIEQGWIKEELLDFIFSLEIIDTHEHLPHQESERDTTHDILQEYLIHYFICDLISAGMPVHSMNQVTHTQKPIMDKWNLLEPYWHAARNTGYARSLDITVKGLYNIDQINRDSIEELNRLFQQSFQSEQYHYVLKEKSTIKMSILDSHLQCDRNYFRSAYRMDSWIFPPSLEELQHMERFTGVRLTSFDRWLDACEIALEKVLERGAVCLKSALAYTRSLYYPRVTRSEAENEFNDFIGTKHIMKWENQIPFIGKAFQNYMMHFILDKANQRQLTYQFHTGIQEGVGNRTENSNPMLMTNLFLEYPDVRFDLFHMGYPFHQQVSALAKNNPNVYIDMCWGHIISPKASMDALDEWLDAVPANKISAFGGDYCFVDAIYGHQYLARLHVTQVLSRKIQQGTMDMDRAKEIGTWLFYTNPMNIFRLGNTV